MKIIIFRRNITNKSGTGQLILMQVKELISQGKKFHVYCMKGFIKVWIGTKILPRKAILKNDQLHIKEAKDYIVIDHDASLYNADYTFIHNLILKEKEQRKPYIEWLKNSHCQIIANSEYTKKNLQNLSISESRISVVYPGYNHQKFNFNKKIKYKEFARKKLGVNKENKIVGFITSGDFEKRGLIHFLDICVNLNNHSKDIHFFVLGSKRIPDSLANHPALRLKQFHYKPRNPHPEFWLSALDIFVYPAKYEEFGMVVPEALAMGIPVITTSNVGASEILPPQYQPWINDKIDIHWFVEKILNILNNKNIYNNLVAASQIAIEYDNIDYASRTLSIIKNG
ncbi:glycosyltransferase family 4 protein [Vibrio cholerae]|uniref:glycosyltransferase family 4 protein n=2 Tax=Vibrio TaxID=662 RepID=UPI0013C33E1B|nr:glycosyltransferase family 4 protein [Vibrio cholerae]MDX5009461.1 glycosyltransferase family 4 protein [Vibrio cholerae]GIC27499.1 group 1 glycosyl transferase [Vibrio cholerae]